MKGEGRTKRKTDKLQIVSLIGGRVCNPRQQHVVNYLFIVAKRL